MNEYQGVLKIKTDFGEFYTNEYVKWLEENLASVQSQLANITASKNNLEARLNQTQQIERLAYEHNFVYDGYADDDHDRS
jgi:hypothetical protein